MNFRKLQTGELIALPRAAEVRPNPGAGDLSAADLSNVVPFSRPRGAHRHAPEVPLPSESHPATAGRARDRMRLAAFAALSFALHAGVLMAISREPAPLASIGEQVISLEIVVGATALAGIAQTSGEQVQAAAASEPQQPEPQREPEQKATEQPQEVQVASEEKAPEQTEPPAEKRAAEIEAARDTEVALAPLPEEKPAEPKAQPPKPMQHAAPAKERRRIEAPTKEHASKQAKASAPSTAANNVGVGRSDADSNDAGLVTAH